VRVFSLDTLTSGSVQSLIRGRGRRGGWALSGSQASFPLFNGDISQLEKRLWESADQLRANSNLSASEYSNPVLGLIFLRYADHKFTVAQQQLEGHATSSRGD